MSEHLSIPASIRLEMRNVCRSFRATKAMGCGELTVTFDAFWTVMSRFACWRSPKRPDEIVATSR